MHECFRFLLCFLLTLFILLHFVQCRNVYTPTSDRDKTSLSDLYSMNLCMFRTNRLCDYLREMIPEKADDEQQLWKRRTSNFYSNW
ncbi:unnamed protein product [Adineta ricciae]|uniref:Secreted protein n=1 Tax=Adineta ricciae TaxID=249248 RepID=A0A813TD16_ADIRI|nr:unnamed protein product [Adineta ricciae]